MLAGRLIDQGGLRISLIVTLSISLIGACLVAFAAHQKSFAWMILARVIFGIGTESGYVARNNACLDYFSDSIGAPYLAMALAMTVASGRLGSLITFASTNAVVKNIGHGAYVYGLWYGAASCLLSLLCAVVFVVIDRAGERAMGYPLRQTNASQAADKDNVHLIKNDAVEESATDELIAHDRDDSSRRRSWWRYAVQQCREFIHICISLDRSFWYLLIVVMLYYGIIFPMQSTATKMLTDRFDVHEDDVWQYTSAIALLAMLLSPALGWLVDRHGQMVHWCCGGFLVLAFALVWLAFEWPPWPAFILMGVAFSVEPAAAWACMPILVPPEHSGFAFGLLSVAINIGMTGSYPAFTSLARAGGNLDLWISVILSGVGAVVCVLWSIRERQHYNSRCNRKPTEVTLTS